MESTQKCEIWSEVRVFISPKKKKKTNFILLNDKEKGNNEYISVSRAIRVYISVNANCCVVSYTSW